jgi:hypothetical protein
LYKCEIGGFAIRVVLLLTLAAAEAGLTQVPASEHAGDLVFWIGLGCFLGGLGRLVFVYTERRVD